MLNIDNKTSISNYCVVGQEQIFTELTPEEAASIIGGASVSVPTTNTIERGRARIRVDLRGGLKDKNFTGQFESCDATFDDFDGTLNISCSLSSTDVNGGQVLFFRAS
ncbi:hypothetical protein LC608_17815 [Nostoc sp. XA010]|uniref:hypothetical protein n=1 Tax=Nostoc sp. XA010 TaxID=2780407 RepID=UPI001E4C9D43|nr:hypothetical protein [Nostoc sp. XA010]MCC5658809.1 hypothetical protein [Nostoc sp. XA010]